MSMVRMFKRMVTTGAGYAASGSLFAVIGSEVQQATGHTGYNDLDSVQASAAGNAVMGAIVGMLSTASESKHNNKATGSLGILLSMAGAALGHKILKKTSEMGLYETVIATGTGGGVVAAGGLGILLTVGLCVGTVWCVQECLKSSAPVGNNPATLEKNVANYTEGSTVIRVHTTQVGADQAPIEARPIGELPEAFAPRGLGR